MLITMIPLGSSSSNELCSLSWWSVRWTYIYLPMALHCNRCWQVFQKKYWTQDCEKKTCSILVVSCVFCNKEVSSSMVETYCTSHPDNSLTSFGDQKLHIINSILGKCETETWLAWSPRHPNPSSNSWMDQERPQKKETNCGWTILHIFCVWAKFHSLLKKQWSFKNIRGLFAIFR